MRLLVFLAPIAAGSFACASGGSGPPKRAPIATRFDDAPRFTPKGRLETLAEASTSDLPESLGLMTPTFSLEGPYGDPLRPKPHPVGSEFSRAMVEHAAGAKGLEAHDGMACVARQLGRFWLLHQTLPAEPLQAFVTARCGAQVSQLRFRSVFGDNPRRMPLARVEEQWASDLDKLKGSFQGELDIGAWAGKREDKVIFMVAAGTREARVNAVRREDDALILEGQVFTPNVEEAYVLVNQGPYGVARCEPTGGAALPAFRFRCPVLPSDSHTWLDFMVRPRRQILGRTVLALLRPIGGSLPDAWADPLDLPEQVVTSTTELGSAVLTAINGTRAQAGLSALHLEPAETHTASRLSSPYFDAQEGRPSLADEIALGLMAGWDVDGKVRSAGFAALALSQTRDASTLATSLLGRPFGRSVVLDPEASRVAVGATLGRAAAGAGVVVTTYTTFGTEPPALHAEEVKRQLNALRARSNLAPAEDLPTLRPIAQAAADEITARRANPDDALKEALENASRSLQAPVQGWWLQASSLADLPFETAMTAAPETKVAIGVGIHAPLEEPWARWIVIVIAPMGGGRTAGGQDVRGRLAAH